MAFPDSKRFYYSSQLNMSQPDIIRAVASHNIDESLSSFTNRTLNQEEAKK